jgi:hypothetical protein
MSHTADQEYIEMFKFIPSGLVVYLQSVRESKYVKSHNFFDRDTGEQITTYQGEITPHSRRRLSKCLATLIEISRKKKVVNPSTGKPMIFKLAFITLTLSAPQYPYTDKDIKKNLLEPFLRHWRNKGMRHYVWRSEQQKNGNIHFHILTDTFILHTDLRNSWNNIQNRLEFINYFEHKHGHRDPNSTDIHAVRGENETKAYLLKYMLKSQEEGTQQNLDFEDKEKQKGKIWDCSNSLKIKNESADFLTQNLWSIISKHAENKTIEEKNSDYFKLYFFHSKHRDKLFPPEFTQAYNQYLETVRTA